MYNANEEPKNKAPSNSDVTPLVLAQSQTSYTPLPKKCDVVPPLVQSQTSYTALPKNAAPSNNDVTLPPLVQTSYGALPKDKKTPSQSQKKLEAPEVFVYTPIPEPKEEEPSQNEQKVEREPITYGGLPVTENIEPSQRDVPPPSLVQISYGAMPTAQMRRLSQSESTQQDADLGSSEEILVLPTNAASSGFKAIIRAVSQYDSLDVIEKYFIQVQNHPKKSSDKKKTLKEIRAIAFKKLEAQYLRLPMNASIREIFLRDAQNLTLFKSEKAKKGPGLFKHKTLQQQIDGWIQNESLYASNPEMVQYRFKLILATAFLGKITQHYGVKHNLSQNLQKTFTRLEKKFAMMFDVKLGSLPGAKKEFSHAAGEFFQAVDTQWLNPFLNIMPGLEKNEQVKAFKTALIEFNENVSPFDLVNDVFNLVDIEHGPASNSVSSASTFSPRQ